MKVYVVFTDYTDTFGGTYRELRAAFSDRQRAIQEVEKRKWEHVYRFDYEEVDLDPADFSMSWEANKP